ncbi:MAG: cysteine hydrolase [Clostridia bacterium]|nr:cysteine hydrolase [Clostridia bacterium]
MKKFLLVIDIQRGFINENTACVKEKIDSLIRSKAFDCVIASVYRNYRGSPISSFMGWREMMTDEEQELVGEAANADYFINKTTYSAYCDELAEILKTENGGTMPDCVYIAGVDTECCVLMTAAELFEKGIRPVVLTDYCGSTGGNDSHNAGILSLESIIGKSNLIAHYTP